MLDVFRIQYRIAKRGLELLAVGGRMVYSTCSLNPIENEAVLHRLLCETEDSVHIIDCRHLVKGLICNPGKLNMPTCIYRQNINRKYYRCVQLASSIQGHEVLRFLGTSSYSMANSVATQNVPSQKRRRRQISL